MHLTLCMNRMTWNNNIPNFLLSISRSRPCWCYYNRTTPFVNPWHLARNQLSSLQIRTFRGLFYASFRRKITSLNILSNYFIVLAFSIKLSLAGGTNVDFWHLWIDSPFAFLSLQSSRAVPQSETIGKENISFISVFEIKIREWKIKKCNGKMFQCSCLFPTISINSLFKIDFSPVENN